MPDPNLHQDIEIYQRLDLAQAPPAAGIRKVGKSLQVEHTAVFWTNPTRRQGQAAVLSLGAGPAL